jgi:hypothetical protein
LALAVTGARALPATASAIANNINGTFERQREMNLLIKPFLLRAQSQIWTRPA